MKIAIDCADLDHSRIDGTRVYIKNLLDLFGKYSDDEFLLYHQTDFNKELKPKEYPNYKDRRIPYPFWWTQTRFPFELRADKPDVCWMPIQQIPLVGPKNTKYVVTIHDLAFKFFEDHFPRQDLRKLNIFTDSAVKRANKIIAVSEATKKDLLRIYPKVSPEKIEVVHHGFDQNNFSREFSEKEKEVFLNENGIKKGDKYLLYVGAIQPRKNIPILIDAFDQLKNNEKHSDLKLVVVGEQAWLAKETIDRMEESKFRSDIIQTGRVSFDALSCIYQSAEIFVFPSLYEGFGLPVLEAFSSNIPVVCAANSSLLEVGSDAAEMFDATNKEELVGVLQKILNNRTIREEMIEKGRQRVKDFSWEKCAKETLEIIKK